ncbi:MAG TPA: hypothetical protein VNL73_05160 [Verrucomicrobiae bacterium]|nr:hypothetical protein [Verrucomicrobiae bacterium]
MKFGEAIKTVRNRKWLASILLSILVTIFFLPSVSSAQIEITLKNKFIDEYKDRATIEATFTVDKAHAKPNSPSKDGDMHVAGRAPEIELPVVAEIMNAKFEKPSVDLVHNLEGTGTPAKTSGAWRIWCEHAGSSHQIQGASLEPFATTNPDHVFEIHPVTSLEGTSLLGSLKKIKGFKTKNAEDAFSKYESIKCHLSVNASKKTTTITTSMAGYNYVEFIMEITGEQKVVDDGRFVMASVLDLDEEMLVYNRRMVFIKDSPPELKVKDLKPGDRLHVLGIPRISLKLIDWRIDNRQTRPEALDWDLPYEMIIVAVY